MGPAHLAHLAMLRVLPIPEASEATTAGIQRLMEIEARRTELVVPSSEALLPSIREQYQSLLILGMDVRGNVDCENSTGGWNVNCMNCDRCVECYDCTGLGNLYEFGGFDGLC